MLRSERADSAVLLLERLHQVRVMVGPDVAPQVTGRPPRGSRAQYHCQPPLTHWREALRLWGHCGAIGHSNHHARWLYEEHFCL